MKAISHTIILLVLVVMLTSCIAITDQQLIDGEFNQKLPGYSEIKVLKREGDWTYDSPRILTLQITLESYPDESICQGQILFFMSDPAYFEFRWNNLECTGQGWLIGNAQYWLQPPAHNAGVRQSQCQSEKVALLLKHWVERGLIKLGDITSLEIRAMASKFLKEGDSYLSNPSSFTVFHFSKIHDLAPNLPDDKKVSTYILSCDGNVDLYLAKTGSLSAEGIPWMDGDSTISPPLTPPVTLSP